MVAMSSVEKVDKKENTRSKSPPEKPSDSVARIESAFLANKLENINNVVDLISLVSPGYPALKKAIHASRRALKALEKIPSEHLVEWLPARRRQYAENLVAVVSAEESVDVIEAAVAAAALTHRQVWQNLLRHSMKKPQEHVAKLIDDFISRFDDLYYDTLDLITEHGSANNRLHFLKRSARKSGDVARETVSPSSFSKQYSAAWLSVLRLKLEPDEIRDILRRLPKELIPTMGEPLRLADFLNSCYNNSSDPSITCAALDAIYVLISKHSLDYPLFYTKLYAQLNAEALFFTEGRERFLELTASFLLNSTYLPNAIVAAFVKRLVRRALTAPTAGTLWCLRLALEILHRNPDLSYLVHRSVNLFDSINTKGHPELPLPAEGDPYDDLQLDPRLSKAEQSSLWELETLKNHISPAVSRLVLLFSRDVRKGAPPLTGTLGDYVGLDYEDLFHAEVKRKARSSDLAYYAPGEEPGIEEIRDGMKGIVSWS